MIVTLGQYTNINTSATHQELCAMPDTRTLVVLLNCCRCEQSRKVWHFCRVYICPEGTIEPDQHISGSRPFVTQVLNTDAEGRLTLADALVFAEKNCGAEAIVDVATLTGACMVALGTNMGGLFSPNKAMVSQLKSATVKSGQYHTV